MMNKELKNINILLSSSEKGNQELALTLIQNLDLDLSKDLPEHYETYQFLAKQGAIKTGLTDTTTILGLLNQVIRLDLSNRHLKGKLPDLRLSNLRFLLLNTNELCGELPDFSSLPNLRHLDLRLNQFQGTIPNFSNLAKLEELYLSHNKLTGRIPNFENLPRLEWLHLFDNQLTGSIPDFSNLPALRVLSLDRNQLTGKVPEFAYLPKLKLLDLRDNCLEGTVSTGLRARLTYFNE
ncbi:MAG: leucine-rich repeat domain-containing protein [Saprospiraceae bacterium]|nr:leucine-rich repeat domain-containing protein [Saprospiraceae bacterium]